MDLHILPNLALQTNAPGLESLMLILSLLGLPEFYFVIIPLILWCYDKSLGLRLLILLSIGAVINGMLKILFHAPRPYWISSDVKAFASESSFGMPSGHAQISLMFLGYIGAWFKKTQVWAICIILIILVGISRMYLGVHFLTDILTGWIFGLIILLLFLRYETSAAAWLLQKPIHIRIFLALFASFTLIILSQMMIFFLGTWQIPGEWSAMALMQANTTIDPLSLREVIMSAGLLFGAAAGAIINREYNPYVVDGSLSQKAVRYLAGMIVLGCIWGALSTSTKSTDLAGYSMTYFRAALAGVWITAGGPYLFCKLGLANNGENARR